MLYRLAIAAALGLAALTAPADAQVAQVLPSCGSASIPVGPGGRLYTDQTGNLCTAGGGGGSSGGSVTAAGTNGTQAQAVQGIAGGVPQNVNAGTDGSTSRALRTTTTGALEPPTAAGGKITRTSTALTANTSTSIAAANANRVALGIQCGSGGVSVDETGGALTAAGVGNGTLFIPANPSAYFTPPVATLTAVTAYTATAQTCVVTEYLR